MYGNPQIPPNSHSQVYLSYLDPAQCGSGGGNSHQSKRIKWNIALKWKRHFGVRERFLFSCFECGFLDGFCFVGFLWWVFFFFLCNWNGRANTGMYHFSCSSRRGLFLPLLWVLKPNSLFWNRIGELTYLVPAGWASAPLNWLNSPERSNQYVQIRRLQEVLET